MDALRLLESVDDNVMPSDCPVAHRAANKSDADPIGRSTSSSNRKFSELAILVSNYKLNSSMRNWTLQRRESTNCWTWFRYYVDMLDGHWNSTSEGSPNNLIRHKMLSLHLCYLALTANASTLDGAVRPYDIGNLIIWRPAGTHWRDALL